MESDNRLRDHIRKDHYRMRCARENSRGLKFCRICGVSSDEEILIHYGSVKYCSICLLYKDDYEKQKTEKKCSKCGITQDISEFHFNKNSVDGRGARCKTCNRDSEKKRWMEQKKLKTM